MTDMKRLMFIETAADAESVVRGDFLEKLPPDTVLYAFDKKAEELLIRNGIAYKTPEEALKSGDYEGIDKHAIDFAKGWYRCKPVAEAITYDGICLSGLVQRDMAFFFSILLDAIILSRKIIEHEKPHEVYCFKRDFASAACSIKAGEGETYYGYFAAQFAPRATELCPKGFTREFHDKAYPETLFVDPHICGSAEAKKNILWVNDSDYLDVSSALFPALEKKYSVKRLRTDAGKIAYKVRPNDKAVPFDISLLEKAFSYEGVDFFEPVSHKFRYLQRKVFPSFIGLVETAKELFLKEEIAGVIVSEDAMPFNKTMVSVANGMKIPTLVLQKGLCAHDISFVPVTADKFAAWGDAARDYLLAKGVDQNKVEVVGSPRFQNYGNISSEAEKLNSRALKELGFSELRGKFFLMALQHGNRDTFFRNVHIAFSEELKIIRMLVEAMRQLPDDALCIKFHPQDELGADVLRYLGCELPPNVRVVHHYPIYSLLKIADVLVTSFSTTALEALLMDIPVVVINPFNRAYNIDYVKEGVAIGVCRDDDLAAVLRDARNRPRGRTHNIDKFLEYHFYRKNNNAVDNISMLIDRMMSQPQEGR